VALAPRPTWEPIPHPPGPDPATAQDFQVLAAGDMGPLEAAVDLVGAGLAAVEVDRVAYQAAITALEIDVVAGAVELGAMRAEAAADTLVDALTRAGQQDGALLTVAGEVATALGVDVPAPEPQPTVPAAVPLPAPL